MDGGLVETKKACEILIAPQCDSSDNEQGSFCNTPFRKRKRKRESLSDVLGVKKSYSPPRQIPWCMGFTSARVSESESELSDPPSTLYFVKAGYESAVTAIITDSEDDLFFLNETVEFEPPDSDTEEEEEDEVESEDEVVIMSSEDEDPGAEGGDEYEEGQESDSDIDEDDLWACPQCNLKNHPLSRQCARCWVERHEWLPHLKRLSSEPTADLSGVTGKSPNTPSLQKCSSLAVAPTIESSSSSSSTLHLITCQGQSHSSGHTTQQTIDKSSENKDSESAFSPDLCVICLMQPRNASLVHGRTGHQVCCIGCAEKLKENKKKCPVCRRKIKLVVKNFL